MLNRIMKNGKTSYYLNIFTDLKTETKKVGKTINQLYHKHRKHNQIDQIIYKNNEGTHPKEIATSFNTFYTNIVPCLDRNLPPSDIDPLTYLRGDYSTSMVVLKVLPQDVVKVINSLNNKKGNINEISISLLKANEEHLALPLSFLFNQSVENGRFPAIFKCAKVIPICKEGNISEMSNYRSISLLSVFSKIFEKLMNKFPSRLQHFSST